MAAILALTGSLLHAQPKAEIAPRYVASIKPASGAPGGFWITPGLFRASNVIARFPVAVAYGLQPWQITGGLGWLDSDHFDVDCSPASSRPAWVETWSTGLIWPANTIFI